MGLSLSTIAVFVVIAIVYAAIIPAKWRGWFLFIASILFVYWLQADIFVRWLDFFLPTLSLIITVTSWYLTRSSEQRISPQDKIALLIISGFIVSLALLRFVPADYRILIASRPPPIQFVIGLLAIFAVFAWLTGKFKWRYSLFLIFILAIFAILKTDAFAVQTAQWLRTWTGQDVSQASAIDLNWIGFSYLAFRLMHTVRDRQSGLLPELSLQEYVTYVLFFPAFISGPIDRAERFLQDFQALSEKIIFSERFVEGFTRISVGIFKKFVIADTLAQGMSLNAINAAQIENSGGAWILLYGYALRLFFDFSGYSDIAIGIGVLFGIKLPENFDQPYMRASITKFWQSWHITLSNWVRFYVFSPLSRYLLKRKPKPPSILIVLITQSATMIAIGLWHGGTINFLIWGIWHGLGLFIHKQWTDRTRAFYRQLKDKPRQQLLADGVAWFITFHFVVLGWVWFALPDLDTALIMFAKLFGLS